MTGFHHEKMDVYRASIEFLTLAARLAEGIPRGNGYVTDQLQRAAMSIALNIAEGAGEFSRQDKTRFYRIARRSATECAAILDAMVALEIARRDDVQMGKQLLDRICAMLTRLAQPDERTGSGSAMSERNDL
ncbi:MAG TPA: four helix bundle protein [Longimicrobiales bacterium]|nr:four helix bundle protein [Longimicrobiales bacterium]